MCPVPRCRVDEPSAIWQGAVTERAGFRGACSQGSRSRAATSVLRRWAESSLTPSARVRAGVRHLGTLISYPPGGLTDSDTGHVNQNGTASPRSQAAGSPPSPTDPRARPGGRSGRQRRCVRPVRSADLAEGYGFGVSRHCGFADFARVPSVQAVPRPHGQHGQNASQRSIWRIGAVRIAGAARGVGSARWSHSSAASSPCLRSTCA